MSEKRVTKFYKLRSVLILMFFTSALFSQTTPFTITGKVFFDQNKAIEFGNAIALHPNDSSIYKGVPFENGIFKLEGIDRDSVLLKINAVGYSDHFILINRTNSDSVIDIGEIILKDNNTLNEITVTAKIPLFEMDGEKVKVNVEGTGLNAAGTALDVLRRSPGVLVNNNDNVTVFGKGTALIYLDGLLISSIDILKSLPSSEIKNIEIINNPSAKYDAAGRAVINLITIKNNLQGYNGNVIQNFLQGTYLFTYTGLRFNYTRKKISTNFSYGFNTGKQWNSDEYKRTYKLNDSANIEMNNYLYDVQNYSNNHYYRAGLNYRPDSITTLGLQYNGFYISRNNVSDNNNSILLNGNEAYGLHTNTKNLPLQINNGINANYSRKFDTLGTELFATMQYGNYIIGQTGKINVETKYNNQIFEEEKRNSNKNDIKIISAQVDLIKVFNKKWKLQSGVKESNIAKLSDIKFENKDNAGNWVSDPSYLNSFEFNENIAAAYSELKFKKKKINTRIGGRAEFTNSEGYSKAQKIINRQYINFFPSAYFGYDFTKDLITSLTLSSRINRPSFQDLDPFINYIDSLSSFRGNPYLLPEYTNSFEASLVYMKEANLTFGYSKTNGALRLVVDKLNDSTEAFTATTKNLNKSETFSFGVTIPYELEWWTTANYFGYFLNTFSYEQASIVVQNNKPTFSIYLYDEFRFKKWFSIELTYEYTSAGVDGIFVSKPFSMLNINLKKTFFKDKLTCRFVANDILSQYIMAGESNIPVYNIAYRSRVNTHYFMLALNYKFGKLKANTYKSRSVSEEEYQRIKFGK
ncbi:MAG: TonB-dependent receptor [Bacteroidetes bacterium]|nr:TonB-dependent receptor [Bacteroidota bacterium]